VMRRKHGCIGLAQRVRVARYTRGCTARFTRVWWRTRTRLLASRLTWTAQAMALRARIILACASEDQPTKQQVAAQLGVSQATVGKWRRRFVASRLDGLYDESRPGAPRTVMDDDVEKVVVKTLEDKPVDATHWSTRSMAKATGISPTTVSRIWRAFPLTWILE